MMLVQNHVESNKAVSNVVVSVILIVITVSLIMIVWIPIRKIIIASPETRCMDFLSSMSIEKACYLNQDEIEVDIKRSFDNLEMEKIKIEFSPSYSLWEISEKKCSDVRLKNKRYGNYSDIVEQGGSFSYVFNFSGLEKQEKLRVAVESGRVLCSIGEKEIENSC